MRPEFYTGRQGSYNAIPDISWYDEKGGNPNWDKLGYPLALQINGRRADVSRDRDNNDFYIMFNASLDPVVFSIPAANDRRQWFRAVDTTLVSPHDILPEGGEEPLAIPNKYKVKSRSIVILISKSTS
jgi:glycogen operon protein